MARIDELCTRYENHIATPWQRNLAGAQKTIFVVYPKEDERRLRARLGLFEEATRRAGHSWEQVDLTDAFAEWMGSLRYKEMYFEVPEDLNLKISDFSRHVAELIRATLTDDRVDEDTVVALYGVASLYGFLRVSSVLREVANDVRGRLLVFFPGQYDRNNYRLLDARDGWNYLAIPITLHNGVNDR